MFDARDCVYKNSNFVTKKTRQQQQGKKESKKNILGFRV